TSNGAVTRTYGYGLQRISENQLNGSTWTPSFSGYDGHGNLRSLTNSAGACYTRMRVKRSPQRHLSGADAPPSQINTKKWDNGDAWDGWDKLFAIRHQRLAYVA